MHGIDLGSADTNNDTGAGFLRFAGFNVKGVSALSISVGITHMKR